MLSRVISTCVISVFVCHALLAATFEAITAEEQALTAVAWQPDASAVVLFEKADLQIMDYPTDASSVLEVRTRIKVLAEAGKEFAEIEIPHSAELRLRGFVGRTVQPDGRVIPE